MPPPLPAPQAVPTHLAVLALVLTQPAVPPADPTQVVQLATAAQQAVAAAQVAVLVLLLPLRLVLALGAVALALKLLLREMQMLRQALMHRAAKFFCSR
jgi:hypothetical protein